MSLKVHVLLGLSLLAGLEGGTARAAGPVQATPFTYLHPARVMPAPQPGEQVLLTLEGQGRTLALTQTQLQSLPAVRYTTVHAQLHKTLTYQGVPLRDLAALGGFAGQDLRLYARNGYVTTIRARDYQAAPIMLAYSADGRPISVLDKGPLTVVLPNDPRRFPAERYGSAWVWFVERITPVP